MKKNTFYCFVMIVIFSFCLNLSSLNYLDLEAKSEKIESSVSLCDEFADDRVLVVLDEDASFSEKHYSNNDFKKINCKDVKNLTSEATSVVQGKRINKYININKFNRVLQIDLTEKSKNNVLEVIDELMKRDDVIYAGPDYTLSVASTCVYPNDTEYTTDLSKWAINELRLNYVWNFTKGNDDVIVGVIDTGINGMHPDLDQAYVSSLCRDFTTGVETGIAESIPTDPFGHGTHVAGIIGAEGNNSIGVSGVCWEVGLASLKAFDENGLGYASNVANAINFAEENEIPILNLSARWYSGERYDYALRTIIENYSGLFVCAAGNDANNNDYIAAYPASYNISNLITVGAIDETNDRAEYSNYGDNTVEIYAPGSNILSTYEDGYIYGSGTSMASPIVAGVAALLLSLDSDLTAIQLKDIIINNSITFTISTPNNEMENAKKLSAIGAIRGVFDLNAFSINVGTDSVKRSEIIKPNSEYYFDKYSIIRIEVIERGTRSFEIISSREVDVTIYNTDLGSRVIYKNYSNNNRTLTFDIYFPIGVFYVKSEYPNATSNGTIEVNINYISSE